MSSRRGITPAEAQSDRENRAVQGRRERAMLGIAATEDAGMRRFAASSDHLKEAVEEVFRVVRPRAGLRVVLDRRARDVAEDQALDRAGVQVELGKLRGAEVGLPPDRLVGLYPGLAVRPAHREAVVLRGDVDAPAGQVLHGVVGA